MISVIVPIYNVEPYLRECLDSICNQTYGDLDIILINDGSPDKCWEICEDYAKKDTRIRVFHTKNQGLSASRNFGLRIAKGEYIGFVDSDDWLEPDMYETLLHRIEATNTKISACGVRHEYLNGEEIYSIDDGVYFGTEAIRKLICALAGNVWNKLYQKQCWNNIRFPDTHTYEDVSTVYKVILNADSLSCVPKPLYHYRKRVGSIVYSRSMNNLMDCWSAFYERYSFFNEMPATYLDQQVIDIMEKQLALVALNIWRSYFFINNNQRDYSFFHTISSFVQRNIPLFGKKDWDCFLRIGIFLCRYPNILSFAALYVPSNVYIIIKKMIKKPFPSCTET